MMMSVDIPIWGRARVLFLFAVLISAGLLGTRWLLRQQIEQVIIEGAVVAIPEEVLKLANVDTDTTLFALEPTLIADRAQRHPWIRRASVRRMPGGEVNLVVEERHPVVLTVGEDGLPKYYIDQFGFRMPYRTGHPFNVPLLLGLTEAFHPMSPVHHPAVKRLVADLADLDPDLDALISEWHVETGGSLTLITVPTPSNTTIRVKMGNRNFVPRLQRLRTYWIAAVLPRPEIHYEWIDLRFNQQIVTRETT